MIPTINIDFAVKPSTWTAQEDAILLNEGMQIKRNWPEIARKLNKPTIACYKRYQALTQKMTFSVEHKCSSFFTQKQKDSVKKFFLEKFVPNPQRYKDFDIRKLFPICEECSIILKKELKVLLLENLKAKKNVFSPTVDDTVIED